MFGLCRGCFAAFVEPTMSTAVALQAVPPACTAGCEYGPHAVGPWRRGSGGAGWGVGGNPEHVGMSQGGLQCLPHVPVPALLGAISREFPKPWHPAESADRPHMIWPPTNHAALNPLLTEDLTAMTCWAIHWTSWALLLRQDPRNRGCGPSATAPEPPETFSGRARDTGRGEVEGKELEL